MPLPSVQDLKDYLRVETDAEDSVIEDLLASALAWAASEIGRPIEAEERTFSAVVAQLWNGYTPALALPIYPVATTPAPVVTDSAGDVVDALSYEVDPATGRLSAVDGYEFDDGPHVITATVGLDAHPDYDIRYEPKVRALVMGLASILYHQRNPGVTSESEGGSSVSYRDKDDLPQHLRSLRESLRIKRIG